MEPREEMTSKAVHLGDNCLFLLDLKADAVSLPTEVLQTWSKEADYTRSVFRHYAQINS